MSLRHAILGILDRQPVHGYELKRVLDEGLSQVWPVKLAAIYPCLRRLEEERLVAHRTEATMEGRPDRKVFEITQAGRQELRRWRRLPPDGFTQYRSPLYLKLLFARPENLSDMLDWIDKDLADVHARTDAVRAELKNCPARFPVHFMRESGVAHLELQAELLEGLRAEVVRRLESGDVAF